MQHRLQRLLCRLLDLSSFCSDLLQVRETCKVWKARFGLEAILRLSGHSHSSTLDEKDGMRADVNGAARHRPHNTTEVGTISQVTKFLGNQGFT